MSGKVIEVLSRTTERMYDFSVTMEICSCTYCRDVKPCLSFPAEVNADEHFAVEICQTCMEKFLTKLKTYPRT